MEKRIHSVRGDNKKKMGIILVIAIVLFITLMGVSLFYLARFWNLNVPESDGAKIEFITNKSNGSGFIHENDIYTDGGITSIVLSGKITVDGTAQVKITSNDTGSIVYSRTFKPAKDEAIKIELNDLTPNAFYKITFYSEEAKSGKLILEGDQRLKKSPDRPAVRIVPSK